MGHLKYDHIKRLITLTSDNIKRLSLYFGYFSWTPEVLQEFEDTNETSNY